MGSRIARTVATWGTVLGIVSCLAQSALAHPGHPGHAPHGFVDGWMHPFTGLDHLLAMLAVGVLAIRSGGIALWLLPASFGTALLAGGLLATCGAPLYGVEYAIAGSIIAFGTLLMLARGPSLRWEAGIVAAFAIFHGHAHIAELSGNSASFSACAAGFLLATGVLHLAGIAAGWLVMRGIGRQALRLGGGAVALAGMFILAALV